MRGVRWGVRVLRRVLGAVMMLALLQNAAIAADNRPSGATQTALASQSLPSLPEALRQFTDTGGFRSNLEQAGLQFTFTYYGDGFSNPRGGVTQGTGTPDVSA
jgi:carbohydrate-selective porin OprB